MNPDMIEWAYLKTVVGNFQVLIEYFFTIFHLYGGWFRKAGVGLIFSLGLAWVALNLFKAPFDKMKGVGVGLGMIVLAGFLNSGTTNTTGLGPASGKELSVGGYYTYKLASTLTGVFSSVVDAAWKGTISEAAGKTSGLKNESMTIAWGAAADQFADTYIKGEGRDAYVDYHKKCGPTALAQAKTSEEKRMLQMVGIGGNTLGLDHTDWANIWQYKTLLNNAEQQNNGFWSDARDLVFGERTATQAEISDYIRGGEDFLKNKLLDSNNLIEGKTGYRIPTESYYMTKLGGKEPNTAPEYLTTTSSSPELSKLLSNGSVSVTPQSNEDYKFYPRNCYDLYLVAKESMRNFREGVKGLPAYDNMKYAGAYDSMSASSKVRQSALEKLGEELKELGYDEDVTSSLAEDAADYSYDFFLEISAIINKWMIQFKIPALITAMALLTVILLILFPMFAVFSVVLGPGPLLTYLRLMLLPFLVVFLNELFLTLSTNIIAYGTAHELLVETYRPGSADASSALSAQNIKAIIFTLLTGAELAIAKFLLWDDFRAVTSFNPGETSINSAGQGLKTAAGAAAVPLAAGSKTIRMASSVANKNRAISQNTTLSQIAKSVANINSASNGRSPNAANGGQGGRSRPSAPNNPGGSGGTGGSSGGGSSPLIPPKT